MGQAQVRAGEGVEPFDLELASGDRVRIVAGYPGAKPAGSGPFDLAPPEPIFGPVALRADPGVVAMFFGTRQRAVSEGPRRSGLGENVLLCNGAYLRDREGPGMDPVDAPGWDARSGRVSLTAQFSFPLAGRGIDASAEIMFRLPDGRGALMSAESRAGYRDALASAFARFIAENPGLPDLLERGLALMDARIMRFEGQRLLDVAEMEASRLEQGAEVLEEAAGFADPNPSP